MKILYLAHRIPYPPNKGDKIRSFNEIKYLSKSHEVDLICLADETSDVRFQEDLKKHCRKVFVLPYNTTLSKLKGLVHLVAGRTISVGYFYWKQAQKIVDQWLADTEYDAIICFSSSTAEYLFRTPSLRHRFSNRESQNRKLLIRNPKSEIPARHRPPEADSGEAGGRNPKLLMDFCDVDSDKWAQYAELTSFPKSLVYRIENRRLASYERRVGEQFDHSVFVSQKEAEIFLNRNPHITNVTVIPNGVDYNYFAPQKRRKAQGSRLKEAFYKALHPEPYTLHPVLLFTGAMDYQANVDGVSWFCAEIFPGIKATLPKAQFYIVGSNPNHFIRKLDNGDGIRVTGFVEDIRPFYAKADICVIPLRMARGIQNKVLEAMSMEKAVVATPQAIQGITAVNGKHIVVVDQPNEFAQEVVSLLNDTNRRFTMGRNARRFVKDNYNWQANMNKLEQLLITRSQ
jgi:sugar transferase (PEP-CTERM/EpsH1 system associated)